jgi:hypothetical protein
MVPDPIFSRPYFSVDACREARYTRGSYFVMQTVPQTFIRVNANAKAGAAIATMTKITWLGHVKACAKAGVGAVMKG